MRISIDGTPEEIAALVLAAQERRVSMQSEGVPLLSKEGAKITFGPEVTGLGSLLAEWLKSRPGQDS